MNQTIANFVHNTLILLIQFLLFPFPPLFFFVVGYRISVDSRLTFGADQKIIEAEVARKKKEYMKNEELAQIYKLYKSMKVISILIIKNFFFSLIQLMKIIK